MKKKKKLEQMAGKYER